MNALTLPIHEALDFSAIFERLDFSRGSSFGVFTV